MTLFLIFIPLFLAFFATVFLMDLSLRPHEKYGWEPATPDFGLAARQHTGITSHMRAIQLNPRFVQTRRNRPSIARAFPVVVSQFHRRIPCGKAHRGCPKGSGLCDLEFQHGGAHSCDTCGRSF